MSKRVSQGVQLRARWQFFQPQFFLGSSLIVAIVLSTMPATADAQVKETPNRWIRGVAKVTLDQSGKSQISFNPRRCRELGPELCEFFRTHEYGHVNLKHLERGVAPSQAEAEADLWAAQNASPNAVRAAKKFFLSGQGGSRVHGSPQERARRMDAGRSSLTRSSISRGSPTKTTTNKANRRVLRTTPKSYSATSKRWVRYRVDPGNSRDKISPNATITTTRTTTGHRTRLPLSAQITVTRKPVQSVSQTVSQSASQTASQASTNTGKTVRYVVRSPIKASQSKRRTSTGYVPRGDFLNPR